MIAQPVIHRLKHELARVLRVAGGLFRKLLVTMRRNPFKMAVMVVFLATIAFIIPRANSLTVLYRSSVLENDLPVVKTFVGDALGVAHERHQLARVISNGLGSSGGFLTEPTTSVFPDRLADIVDGSFKLEIKEKYGEISIGVRLVNLLQAYIDRYFSGDAVFVIVETFSIIGEVEKTYETTVRVLPDTPKFIGGPPKSRALIRRSLATMFENSIFDAVRDCTIELCGANFPREKIELRDFAKVLLTLRKGPLTEFCRDIDRLEPCYVILQEKMSAMELSEDTPAAVDFVQALLSLAMLKAIGAEASSEKLIAALDEVHVRLGRAMSSHAYFRTVLDSKEALTALLERNGLAHLDLTVEFLQSYGHYVAGRRLLNEGKLELALAQYNLLRGAPSWFDELVAGSKSYASVFINPNDRSLILTELERFVAGDYGSTWLSYVRAGSIAKLAVDTIDDTVTEEERLELLETIRTVYDKSVQLTSKKHDQLAVLIDKAKTLHGIGEIEESDEIAASVVAELELHMDDPDYRFVFGGTAIYYAEIGDYVQFKMWSARTVEVAPQSLCEFEGVILSKFSGESDASKWISELREVAQYQC